MQGSNCTPLSAALLKEVLKHLPKALDFLHTEANVIHTSKYPLQNHATEHVSQYGVI